jgi:argininosuccinate lyase
MPQKKNFPVLEPIRARTAHLGAAYADIAAGQRNTPYSNSVEVSKEANANVPGAFDDFGSVLRLFGAVLENLDFRAERMREACERDYFGGFTLANLLTLRAQVPWRTAQVIAGRYIVGAVERSLPPAKPDGPLLDALLAEHGCRVADAEGLLAEAMSVPGGLAAKRTDGSTGPEAVRRLLAEQAAEFDRIEAAWAARRGRIQDAEAEIERQLARPEAG